MDEMERAHRNDYEYEKKLREARTALRNIVGEGRLGHAAEDELLRAIQRLGTEMDHIVARWN
jgi:hypothetical protein